MNATILIVEDDEALGRILARVLGREGFRVIMGTSMAHALELARSRAPDLALIDLHLPDGSGLELGGTLRAERSALPLVLMTAFPLTPAERRRLEAGFHRVLSKPFDLPTLREALDAALAEPCQG
jgi:DNA-binding response OmpR family regulator